MSFTGKFTLTRLTILDFNRIPTINLSKKKKKKNCMKIVSDEIGFEIMGRLMTNINIRVTTRTTKSMGGSVVTHPLGFG